ncbi:hypothetical protein TNCT_144731 [Trichonephila clavata]|uniref:Uncharacterized protein n=1 Tax=Trichonephila clavata TaxID=2740835 RepID=A0A8X6JBP0_TRICU|nr:hypothetical protein TNCT_144731 [Trichonephila clavata]
MRCCYHFHFFECIQICFFFRNTRLHALSPPKGIHLFRSQPLCTAREKQPSLCTRLAEVKPPTPTRLVLPLLIVCGRGNRLSLKLSASAPLGEKKMSENCEAILVELPHSVSLSSFFQEL